MKFEEAQKYIEELKVYYDIEVNKPMHRCIQPCPICGAYDPDLIIPPMPNEMFCSRCDCNWGPYGGHGNISQKTVNYIVNGNKGISIGRHYNLEEIINIGIETNRLRINYLINEVKIGGVDIKEILRRMTIYGNKTGSAGCISVVAVAAFFVIGIILSV